MIKISDSIISVVIGSLSTLAGAAIPFGYQFYKDRKNEKEFKAALLKMFIASVDSYLYTLVHSEPQTEWDSSFWNKSQIELARRFPSEAAEFNDILVKTSFFHRGVNRKDCIRRLNDLLKTLQKL